MPTGFETVIRSLLQEQAQQGRAQMAQQSLGEKMQQQQELEQWRQQLYQNAQQRIGLSRQRLTDTEQQNTAFSNYVLGIDDNDPAVSPDMKMQLRQIKSYIANNPGLASSGIAKQFLPKVKPAGWQVLQTVGNDLDGNPTTFYEIVDKTSGRVGPMPAAPGTFAGALPAAPAPEPTDPIDKSFEDLKKRHGLGG